jgi:glutamine synthetase type III
VLSLAVAWVFAQTVDRWAIDWGKMLYQRFFQPAANTRELA